MSRAVVVGLLVLAGCRDHRSAGDTAASEPPAPATDGPCAAIDYARDVELPEASGATWLPGDDVLLVVSDSGNRGQYAELDARGQVVRGGHLPLGNAGEDLEGLARDGARVWGLTSSGWLRAWERTGDHQWRLAVDGFAIDPASKCEAQSVNCGANYEGVCLAPAPLADGCDGYALSKSAGALVCLHRRGADRFAIDPARTYPVGRPAQVADCAIADDGAVWTGDNGFGFMMVRRWIIGAGGATLAGAQALGLGFPEVLALGPGGVVYRFSDLGGSPSLTTAFRCPAGLPKAGPASPAQ